ncbi:MAG: ABC transporter permease [Candidatus Hydrogenedentes bacterium]|nr:ABC transporter permease [Candidatus Hydrogenedentota bacterium]
MTTLAGLVFRGIQYHRRLHLGLAAGALIACAVLTGSLLVGHSVKKTLYDIATARLGLVSYAIDWGSRYFDARLGDGLRSALPADTTGEQAPSLTAVLALRGVAESPPEQGDKINRVNHARLYGVDEHFGGLASLEEPFRQPGPQEAYLNEAAARLLGATAGTSIILRIPKPSQIPAEAPLAAGGERDTAVARVRVLGVLTDTQGGRFSLSADQSMPVNIYVNRDWLGELSELPGKANLLLSGAGNTAEELRRALSNCWRPEQLGFRIVSHPSGILQLESERLFIEDSVAEAVLRTVEARPVLTYLVNHIGLGDRATPYSFVVAGAAPPDTPEGSVCVNQWLADLLGAGEGDTVSLSWYEPLASGGFKERRGEAPVHKILPMESITVERDLSPRFPGLSDVNSCQDWDIGLPLEEELLADQSNEAYWKAYGQTPKLLTTFETGQDWWGSRYGTVTALRFPTDAMDETRLSAVLKDTLDPALLGLSFMPVREDALEAVAHAIDFGALFTGMSLFLIAAALLLLSLLYAHGLQQRAWETGILLASGWTPARVRTWLLLESLPGCMVGSIAGAACGAAYARLLLYGLSRFWPGAVAGTPVLYHTAPPALLAQGALITVCAVFAVFTTCALRAGRRPIRELLQRDFGAVATTRKGADLLFAALGVLAALLAAYAWRTAFLGQALDLTPAFFTSGMGLLIMLLCAYGLILGYWARRAAPASLSTAGLLSRQLARRRSRSLGMAAIIGSGLFMVQSVVSMQAAMTRQPEQRDSGAGGFTVFATTTLPVTVEGESILGLPKENVVPLRVKDGDDAGCLNLNRAREPRLYGVDPDALISRNAFAAPGAAAALWALMTYPLEAGVYPALVGDADTAMWGLQARTDPQEGTEFAYGDSNGSPFTLRAAGNLPMRLSLFQGSLLLSEENFVRLFPHESGYRAFLIESADAAATAAELNRTHGRLGMEAVPSAKRLEGFYAVERAYLAMFLVLGGLGMMLGAGGAAVMTARGLAERRAEFALFLAVGFTPGAIRRAAMLENTGLVGAGLFIGFLAAAMATLPLLLKSGQAFDFTNLAIILAAIVFAYLVSVLFVTALFLRTIPLSALRRE